VCKRDKTIREFSGLANPKPQTLNPKPSGLCFLVGSDGSRKISNFSFHKIEERKLFLGIKDGSIKFYLIK
jgi:hypothetical protein